MPTHTITRRRSRGQAIAELALILPVLLALVGVAVDFARVFTVQLELESATREAAEWAATGATTSTAATSRAKERVCVAASDMPGFAAPGTYPADPTTCTSPAVTVTSFTYSTAAPLATPAYPVVTVTVRSTMAFRPLFVYPLLPNGSWTLSAERTFSIVQNRA